MPLTHIIPNLNRYLAKSLEELQTELKTNAETYEDSIQNYEKEATAKDKRITQLEVELAAANEKIDQLEARVKELSAEVETEQSINANLTATVSQLEKELASAKTNVGGFDEIEAILRQEVEAYKSQLSEANADAVASKQKRIELEQLISKTRDSLVDEKKRVVKDMSEKDSQIAKLDSKFAEQLNDIHAARASLEKTNVQLTKMTNRHNSEKDRADALDKKIAKLNQVNADSLNAIDSSGEVDRLMKLLDDVSKSNEDYKSLVTTYKDKIKFLSQELLLSGKSVSDKQSQLESLKEELANTITNKEDTVEEQKSVVDEVSTLKARLDKAQAESTKWKAQANGMIVQLTNDLRERDHSMMKLQQKLDEVSKEQAAQTEQQTSVSSSNNEALEKQMAELKASMERTQMKAKEKMKQKNKSLKELEDSVAKLNTEMLDLRREKNQITERLNEEIQHGKDSYQIQERQLRETENRLAKENIAQITKLEDEMNETIQELEMEVKSLREKDKSSPPKEEGASVKNVNNDYRRVLAMEEILRRSREKEVALLNDNMKMKNRMDNMVEEQLKQSSKPATVFDDDDDSTDDEDEDDIEAVNLPRYYKEKQRPIVIRIVNKALDKIFRRRKKLL